MKNYKELREALIEHDIEDVDSVINAVKELDEGINGKDYTSYTNIADFYNDLNLVRSKRDEKAK